MPGALEGLCLSSGPLVAGLPRIGLVKVSFEVPFPICLTLPRVRAEPKCKHSSYCLPRARLLHAITFQVVGALVYCLWIDVYSGCKVYCSLLRNYFSFY